MKMEEAHQSHDWSRDYAFGAVVQSLLFHDKVRVGQRLVNSAVRHSLLQDISLSHFSREVHHILQNLAIAVAVLNQPSLTHFLSHDAVVCQGLGSCELGGVGGETQGNTTLVQRLGHHHWNSL